MAKDSLGNDIKIDNIINVRARYFEYNQFKSTQLMADIVLIDLEENQTMKAYPINSEFIFQNRYAIMRGDERALDQQELRSLNSLRLNFPADSQMIYDTGEDLKMKLTDFINAHKIENYSPANSRI